jgi:hypothetical protein
MSHLAGHFLSRERLIDETVRDAVIGAVIGTMISTRNAIISPIFTRISSLTESCFKCWNGSDSRDPFGPLTHSQKFH